MSAVGIWVDLIISKCVLIWKTFYSKLWGHEQKAKIKDVDMEFEMVSNYNSFQH